jgi:guanylate kinase
VNTAAFSNLLSQGAFLEHTAYAGSLYGTSLKAIKDLKAKGLVPLLDLELNGVRRVAEIMSGDKAKFALVLPPNLEVLEQRLRSRATETDEVVRRRLDRGRKEMERMVDAGWSLKLVNDNPEEAYRQLEAWALGIINEGATSTPIPEILEGTGVAGDSVVG